SCPLPPIPDAPLGFPSDASPPVVSTVPEPPRPPATFAASHVSCPPLPPNSPASLVQLPLPSLPFSPCMPLPLGGSPASPSVPMPALTSHRESSSCVPTSASAPMDDPPGSVASAAVTVMSTSFARAPAATRSGTSSAAATHGVLVLRPTYAQ